MPPRSQDFWRHHRGEIWVENGEQRRIAEAYVRQLTLDHTVPAPIVTRIDKAMPFYPAECYRQNFIPRHPDNLYIVIDDAPKVTALAWLFPDLYTARPVLVRIASTNESLADLSNFTPRAVRQRHRSAFIPERCDGRPE